MAKKRIWVDDGNEVTTFEAVASAPKASAVQDSPADDRGQPGVSTPEAGTMDGWAGVESQDHVGSTPTDTESTGETMEWKAQDDCPPAETLEEASSDLVESAAPDAPVSDEPRQSLRDRYRAIAANVQPRLKTAYDQASALPPVLNEKYQAISKMLKSEPKKVAPAPRRKRAPSTRAAALKKATRAGNVTIIYKK